MLTQKALSLLWPAVLLCSCTGVLDGETDASSSPGASGGATTTGGSGSGGVSSAGPSVVATPRFARLSRLQWENSIRDLLGLGDISELTAQVGGDALVGLDNEAEALRVGSQLRSDLEKVALAIAQRATTDSATLARLVPEGAPADDAGKARSLITTLGLRAYRRPLEEAEVQSYEQLYAQAPSLYPGEPVFSAGIKLVLSALLQSPHFLYRSELCTEKQPSGFIALSDYEVAAKLALSLTATLPDSELFAAAKAGELRTKLQVVAQAERLLATPAGAAARDHLHFQTYRLGAYDGIVRSAEAFPEFTAKTPGAMREEVRRFLGYLFDQDQGIASIFTTPVGFVNDDLAPLYGLPKSYGGALTRVDLDPSKRSGLLTLAGFLSSYAVVNDPDTIHRGVFVNQRILCRELPPPDPKATALVPLDEAMTNRERVEATTGPGTCGAGCHSTVINPPGFAFEHFDAIGRYREEDRGKPINAADAYDFTDGLKSFNGAIEFNALLAKSPQAHACYIEGWMSYLSGHPPVAEERPLIDQLTTESLAGKLSLRDLVERLVSADGYLNRLP